MTQPWSANWASALSPRRVTHGDSRSPMRETWRWRRSSPRTLEEAEVAVRTGIGVDVHAFGDGKGLALAGLQWPDETALSGHSDGDVAAHAACDAILSAAGLGDLGAIFGTDRPEWAGASGAALLTESARL